MATENQSQYFDEEDLEISDQISLYSELIRIIEKDLDDIGSKNSREGWTIAGILGGIVGAAWALIGQTRDLTVIPSETVLISFVFLLFFYFIWSAYNSVSSDGNLVKEGRLVSHNEILRGRIGFVVARTLILALGSYFLFQTDIPLTTKVISIILIFLPALYVGLTVMAMRRTKRPFGNNPKFKNIQKAFTYFFLSCFLIPLLLLGRYLHFPVGPELSAAYVLGVSISAIVVLLELLFAMVAPSSLADELRNLRDDIVFQRLNLNDAINKYKILKEGKSLFDEMKSDYDKLMSYLYFQEDIYDEQRRLLEQIKEQVLIKDDTAKTLEIKNNEVGSLSKSFQLHQKELENSISLVRQELDPFYAKLGKAAGATGDYEGQNTITQLIQMKFDTLVQKEKEINLKRQLLTESARSLTNDDEDAD